MLKYNYRKLSYYRIMCKFSQKNIQITNEFKVMCISFLKIIHIIK